MAGGGLKAPKTLTRHLQNSKSLIEFFFWSVSHEARRQLLRYDLVGGEAERLVAGKQSDFQFVVCWFCD